MDQELVQYLDEKFNRVEQRFDRVEQRLDAHDQRFSSIDQRFQEVHNRIDDRFEEVKRHTGILVEDLRCQVRLVAEGFATFVEGRYTQDQARIDDCFRETQALLRTSFGHLAQQDDQLRQRVENLERKGQP